jgi:hypothetical protein
MIKHHPSAPYSRGPRPHAWLVGALAVLTLSWTTGAQTPSAAGGQKLVPLPIVLPQPVFEGTPRNLKVPNLEKPRWKAREPFLAPAGVKNVARRKPVTSSDMAPIIGDLQMITDGDRSGEEGSFVELGPGKQYVTIDLGAPQEIYAVLFWHFHNAPRIYFDVIVRLADDADFKTNVRTLFNNDHDNTSGLGAGPDMNYVETSEGRLVDARGALARYVRLYSNGNDGNNLNHYVEVEVFGRPPK